VFAVPPDRLRIALVSRELAPFFGAGIGVYAANMARAWARAGHEIHVITGRWANLEDRAKDELPGVIVHSVRPRSPSLFSRRAFDFRRYALGVRALVRSLHKRSPLDYIEFPDYWGEGHALLASLPRHPLRPRPLVAIRLHTPTHECRIVNAEGEPDGEVRAIIAAEDAAIRAADVVISPTRALLSMVSSRLHLPSARGEVVPYPFDWPIPHDPAPREEAPPVILFYGRFEHRKGAHVLIDATQSLLDAGRPLRVRLIGGDTSTGPNATSMLASLRRRILPRHASAFEFLPAMPRPALALQIDRAAICCFPSLWENFPNACLEAMTRGSIVVGSDAGGMAEIIRDGVSGLLFRSGDAPSLALALARALTDDHLRASAPAEAAARVRELCDPRAIVRRMEGIIERRRDQRS
jgi:glycosyltransferase involved in cell wall biosynthesis